MNLLAGRLHQALRDRGVLGARVDSLGDGVRIILDDSDTRLLLDVLATSKAVLPNPTPTSATITNKQLNEIAEQLREVTSEPLLGLQDNLAESELEILNEYLHSIACDLDPDCREGE